VSSTAAIVIAAIALGVIFLVPPVRRVAAAVTGVVIAIMAIAVSAGGTAVLMNNVTIFDSPGTTARIERFLTVDWAATSENGLGSAQCEYGWPGAPIVLPIQSDHQGAHHKADHPPVGKQAPAPAAQSDEDYYPELVVHGYPGIPRAELFAEAQQAVASLGGWKIANADRVNTALDCVYTSRILRSEDDVRIVVTKQNRIFVCSRSQSRLFPGDFGANIGHIKEFQQAVEPGIDKFYNEQENKMRGQDNGQRS
jgi:hypothetical protein